MLTKQTEHRQHSFLPLLCPSELHLSGCLQKMNLSRQWTARCSSAGCNFKSVKYYEEGGGNKKNIGRKPFGYSTTAILQMIKILQVLSILNPFKVAVSEIQIRRSIYNMTDLSENIFKYHGKSTFQITPSACNIIGRDRYAIQGEWSDKLLLSSQAPTLSFALQEADFQRIVKRRKQGVFFWGKGHLVLNCPLSCCLDSKELSHESSNQGWKMKTIFPTHCAGQILCTTCIFKCWILPKFKKKSRWK